jgi:hypothetical protein
MRAQSWARGAAFASAFFALISAPPAEAREPFQHIGPVEAIDNGVVRLEVAPQIGRIVSLRKPGGKEWIAVTDAPPPPGWHWNPWGGDRIWPTAQFLNYQIYGNNGEDPVIDGQPWKVISQTKTSMELESGLSPELGLVVTRRIELPPGRAEVVQTFRLDRRQPSAFPVNAWVITVIPKADVILMDSDEKSTHPNRKPFTWWKEQTSGPPPAQLLGATRTLKVNVEAAMKVGTYGTWIAGVSGNEALLQTIAYPRGELYLEASNLQAFWDPKKGICELETLSPSWSLREGESKSWTVKWQLVEFPTEVTTIEQKAEILEKAARK